MKQVVVSLLLMLSVIVEKKKARGRALKQSQEYICVPLNEVEKKKARGRALKQLNRLQFYF